jgi:hypothetical protein
MCLSNALKKRKRKKRGKRAHQQKEKSPLVPPFAKGK